jgi:hypothetical protein
VRVKIVSLVLLALFAATIAMIAGREHVTHSAPRPPAAPETPSAAAASASQIPAGAASVAPDGAPLPLIDRPLRVIALGWDLAAPAVLANGGLEPSERSDFGAAGVPTLVRPVDTMSAVEGALARGGADKDGADVAVVPLADLVASYERLRALDPEVFFVVGWSRGREALVSTREVLPGAGDKSAASMVGTGGEAATFLGLFALDANGTPPGAVRLVKPGATPDDAALAAIDRDESRDAARRNILLTTADASHLVPFVAVAPRALLESHRRALAAWARVWMEATDRLGKDPGTAARAIATAPGAPDTVALVARLGELAPASLHDNARVFGLSGRGALTLEALFQQAWRIWRAVGALATSAPDSAPIDGAIVASLVRALPSLAVPSGPRPRPATPPADSARVLVTYRQPEGRVDTAALLATAGLLADVFDRSSLRVSVTKGAGVDPAATRHLLDDVVQRFDVAPERLFVAKRAPARAGAAIEVVVAP